MSVFFTDTIILIDTRTDENGVKEEYEHAPLSARVEDFNKLITDSRGQETLADMIIFADFSFMSQYTDRVKIITKGGIAYNQPNKKFLIKKTPLIHNFTAHHKEIYV
jgi:ABC-type transporter Mla maintaining outer membrane lipid asymmetry ATPase subunit MlaF